jgi:hypothetical protein
MEILARQKHSSLLQTFIRVLNSMVDFWPYPDGLEMIAKEKHSSLVQTVVLVLHSSVGSWPAPQT